MAQDGTSLKPCRRAKVKTSEAARGGGGIEKLQVKLRSFIEAIEDKLLKPHPALRKNYFI